MPGPDCHGRADHDARHAAWPSRSRLQALIDTLPFDTEPDTVVDELERAITDARTAIDDMRAGPREADHYER